ncbi:MAG: hypothetical protein AB1642_02070 [Pseudomonadota bacterium]
MPDALPAWRRPLPFLYESTGVFTIETKTLRKPAKARAEITFDGIASFPLHRRRRAAAGGDGLMRRRASADIFHSLFANSEYAEI